MCMLTGGDDAAWVEDVSKKYGLMKRHGALLEKGTAQRFLKTNTTIIFYWSASLCEIEPIHKSDAHTKFAMHLDRPAVFIRTYLRFMDILILNTGHHWNRGKIEGNKWVMYLDGKVDTAHSRTMADAKSLTINKIASWLHSQKKKNLTRAEIYMRSLSPRHFFDGEWNSGGRCDDEFLPSMQLNITGHMSDPVIESAISGTSLRLLNITYISQFRFDGHISKYRPDASHQDCLHWCLPGVPDVWNEMLYADILLWQNEQRGA
ncbi:hypothetical protein KP509_28G058200 [Ceratopteris richardii]|nr:hypothetical protein KP509_28G058200 [Ceratopteris richardii]